MTLTMALIRSGVTRSGKEGRMLGVINEPLAEGEEERLLLKKQNGRYPEVSYVFTSDLLRSRETAQTLYPNIQTMMLSDLRAFDVGAFQGKQMHELLANECFRKWLSSRELQSCPQGESPYAFSARSLHAVRNISHEMASHGIECAALITHKTVIREIVRRFCVPRGRYLDCEIPYGGGYIIKCDTLLDIARIVDKL